MLFACRLLADALPPDVKKAAAAAAIIRHGVVWTACGCNSLTLGWHLAAIAYVYGGDENKS